MSKYDPLQDYLLGLKGNQWRASFDQIEEMLGFPLPRSALEYQAWWANERSEKRDHKRAWLAAGWRTANLNLTGRTVEFVRDRSRASIPKQRAATVPPKPPPPPAPYQQVGPVHVVDLLSRLAERRPLFHSEADFQHALAWTIHEVHPEMELRLEYKPFPDERMYCDIWARGETNLAIELKYLTRKLQADINGELYSLLDQSTHDIRRYDTLKDLGRLESIVNSQPNTIGHLIALSNDTAYWKVPERLSAADADFRVHEGRMISGELRWSDAAGQGTTKGREATLKLVSSYSANWRDYATVGTGSYDKMRYLLITVLPT